ncbi:MAG TPA: LEA type 2 family protein [Burkholderiales bacterium]|nr:LEA type 2 family protein [Betaproteobacteria bacterium]HQR51973.1 LEA type 2 family protein [Burkholderiales bacterium]
MKAIAPWVRILAASLVLAGCATLAGLDAPRVSISNITPQDMTLFEQKFIVTLRIQNPNDVPLGVTGISFNLDLNGKSFASGLSSQQVTVPRFGSEVIDVEVFSGLTGILRQLQTFAAGGSPRFTYRLRGKAYLDQPTSLALPFDEQGEIELPVPVRQ